MKPEENDTVTFKKNAIELERASVRYTIAVERLAKARVRFDNASASESRGNVEASILASVQTEYLEAQRELNASNEALKQAQHIYREGPKCLAQKRSWGRQQHHSNHSSWRQGQVHK